MGPKLLFGIVPDEILRVHLREPDEQRLQFGIPPSKRVHHLINPLIDAKSKADAANALLLKRATTQ